MPLPHLSAPTLLIPKLGLLCAGLTPRSSSHHEHAGAPLRTSLSNTSNQQQGEPLFQAGS